MRKNVHDLCGIIPLMVNQKFSAMPIMSRSTRFATLAFAATLSTGFTGSAWAQREAAPTRNTTVQFKRGATQAT